jgi:hypothetical protein
MSAGENPVSPIVSLPASLSRILESRFIYALRVEFLFYSRCIATLAKNRIA